MSLIDPESFENEEQVPFIIEKLPTSVKKLQALFEKYPNCESLVVQRLRDYHDPLANESTELE